jgi:hypothetical protein
MASIQWDKARIESLSTDEVKNLLSNASERNRPDIVEICNEVLATRKSLNRTTTNSNRSNGKRAVEHELDKKLVELQNELKLQYDLTTTTAKKLSLGVKGFKAHEQLSSKDRSKTGAHQTKTRQLSIDRYISYRLKESSCALICLQFLDEEQIRFHVMGPSVFLDNNYKDPRTLRPYLNDNNEKLGSYEGGEEYFNFEEAAERYKYLIQKVAPPIN